MKIKTKIALQFTLLVFIILAIFSFVIYYLSESYRQNEFYQNLNDRAITTARLLIKEKDIDKKLLKVIDRNTLNSLYAAQVLVFNEANEIAYSNYEADTIYYSPELLNQIKKEKYVKTTYNQKQVVGTLINNPDNNKEFVVLAEAIDEYGQQKLKNIKEILISGLLISSFLTILLSFLFSSQALKPISKINEQISAITANNLRSKLGTGNNKDEIAHLAINFNAMMERIENSFELQKSFVSNASHELRTPLAAIKSEIQIALESPRTTEEYKKTLNSLLSDNQNIIKLINSLLSLAKTGQDINSIVKANLRLDELLFATQEDLLQNNPDFKVHIDYKEIPENSEWVSVFGNKELLSTLFLNLFENACKYSSNKTALVTIISDKANVSVQVLDEGIGIDPKDLNAVFEPFFRTKQSAKYKGNGIGLSICKKITEIHQGQIKVASKKNVGSTFTVVLPHI